MRTLVHLTTLHSRSDLRVFVRQAQTLAKALPLQVTMVVADGLGDHRGGAGEVAIHDLGDRRRSLFERVKAGTVGAFAAIRRIGPAVVHFHDPELIPLGLALRLFGYKVIYDVHEDVPRQILTKQWVPKAIRLPLSWAVGALEWVAVRVFSAVVPATPTIAARFPRRKTTVIFNYPGLEELALPASASYGDRPLAFTYIGGIAEYRGITEVVRAFSQVEDHPVTFDLAGDIYPADYEDVLKRTPGWDRVTYHGHIARPEVARIMGRVRGGLVVHHPIPNEIHALPMKLFEYMNVGLPVIASDFPPLRAIIGEAGCGLLVNPLDPAEIAGAIRWIVEHPEEAEAMGERGRVAGRARYNWASEAANLVSLYQSLLREDELAPPAVAPESRPASERLVVHLTTVHSRIDTRIVLKEAQALAVGLPCRVALVVADGLGDSDDGPFAVRDIGRLGTGRVRRMLAGSRLALHAVRRLRPDVVHFHDPELIPLGVLLRLCGYQVVYDVHEDVPRQILLKHWVPGVIRRPLALSTAAVEWVGARVFSAIVPATPTIAARFPNVKTTTVFNYVIPTDMTVLSPEPYESRPAAFAYIGVIAGHRGMAQIIGALDTCRDLSATIEMVGPFSPTQYQNELCRLAGWDAVHYRGIVSRGEVAGILNRTRAGLALHLPVANKVDALPVKLFEYMSAGLPVIASDFPVLREIVGGAQCGLLVDPYNETQIAGAMRWVLEHPEEAKAMGERGRLAAMDRYNWSSEAEKIVTLYRRLLAVA